MSYGYALLVSRAGLSKKGALDEASLRAAAARARDAGTGSPRGRPPDLRLRDPSELVGTLAVEHRPTELDRYLALDAGMSPDAERVLRAAAEDALRAYPHAPVALWRYWMGSGSRSLDVCHGDLQTPLPGGEALVWLAPAAAEPSL